MGNFRRSDDEANDLGGDSLSYFQTDLPSGYVKSSLLNMAQSK